MNNNDHQLAKRLARFSALAATAVGANQAAHANVVIWDVNQLIPGNGGSVDLTASFNTAFKINFASAASGTGTDDRYFWGPNDNLDFINYGGVNDPARWGSGVAINAGAQNGNASAGGVTSHYWYGAKDYATGSHDLQYKWTDGTTGFMGIRFDAGASSFHYGWVEITADASGVMTVDRWALSDTANETAITPESNPVPEPSTLSLFALAAGAGGVRELRRRRKAKPDAVPA